MSVHQYHSWNIFKTDRFNQAPRGCVGSVVAESKKEAMDKYMKDHPRATNVVAEVVIWKP